MAVAPRAGGPAAPIAAPNPAAIQRKLAQSTAGGKPLPATVYDQGFQNAVGQNWNKYQQGTSGLDLQQARSGADYETARSQDIRQRGYDQEALSNTMADRGLTFSGARVNRSAMLGQQYVDMLNRLATGHQRTLEDITRQRQQLAGQYASGLNSAESNYIANIQKYLQSQATAQAQAAQTQAQGVASRAVSQGQQAVSAQQNADIQNQIAQLSGQNPISAGLPTGPVGTDWDAVARAYKLGKYSGLPTGPTGTNWAAVAKAYGIGQ